MKILSIHANFVEYQALKKAMNDAEDCDKEKHKVDECLVIFTAVEKCDEQNPEDSVAQYVKEVTDIAKQVNADNIVIYPYAHLSSELSKPTVAVDVMKSAEAELKKVFSVSRAPFGWYKYFDISCKGHPLSELSREFGPDKKKEEISEALKAEEKLKSYFYIMDVDGSMHEVSVKDNKIAGFNFSKYPNLEKYSLYELAKVRVAKKEPPHVALMKKHELVDYEPGSDPGNLRFYPKGRFIKSLLESYVVDETINYGAMEIEAPIMYDFEHPSLKRYLHRFPARQYTIETPNKKCFLRFAACFGQFLMMHDATVSYRQLPLRLFEMTRYSFRVEQRGELTGLRRLRAFTMPDCHAFCTDMDQAKIEFMNRVDLCWRVTEGIGFNIHDEIEFAYRATRDFFENNKGFLTNLVKRIGKPMLVEIWDDRKFYFVFKFEWNVVDALDKAACLATDQIDVENAERYGIEFTTKDNKREHPLILHCSPSGAIERVMYGLLEREAIKQSQGKTPMLPLWLCPTQVRVIPVSIDKHLVFAEKLTEFFNKHDVRADLDDNEDSVGKRIRNSGTEWIPYTIVVGDNELDADKLTVRVRETGEEAKFSKEQLVEVVHDITKGRPFKQIPLPVKLSKRPVFVG